MTFDVRRRRNIYIGLHLAVFLLYKNEICCISFIHTQKRTHGHTHEFYLNLIHLRTVLFISFKIC